MNLKIHAKTLAITFFIFGGLLFIMDSCMQFRMSKTEINNYFVHKPNKGILHYYDINSRHINYLKVENNQQPLVVFVHGSPGSLDAFIDYLGDSGLASRAQMISVDRPGFGYSNFGDAEKSLRRQSELLKPLLEKNKKKGPVILVGHSLGGPVIVRMAMDYPELVDGLIIVAGSIAPDLEPKEWFRAPLAFPFIKWLLPRSIRASNDEIYHLKPHLQEMLPLYSKIKIPVTVIQGMQDELVNPGNAAFAKQMMVNTTVKLVMMDSMNHFVPWTKPGPQYIRNAIYEHLDGFQKKE